MKKIIMAMAILAISTGVNAQITFGVKGGVTAANFQGKGSFEGISVNETSGTKIGFYAGALAEIGVSESFFVQPEVLFSMLGGADKEDKDNKLDLAYITVPVLAKYKMEGLSIYLGPQIGYLVSANAKDDEDTEDVKDQFKSTDFSAVVGVGYTLESGLGFDARYQLGLSSVAKESIGNFTQKNNAFSVGIHFMFNQY